MPPTSESPPPLQIYIGGSSSGAELVAGAVRDVLSRLARDHYPELAGAQFGLWTNAHAIGSAAFGAVSDAAAAAQFGVFVLAADDRVDDGEATATAPSRDVIYELGVFTGQLGIDRVFLVSPSGLQVPAHVRAVKNAEYEPAKTRGQSTLRDSVHGACHAILEAMNNVLQARPARTDSERDQAPTAQSESPAESVLMAELLVDLRRGNLPALRDAGHDVHGRGVVHPRYGLGTIVSVGHPQAGDTMVTVLFDFGAVTVPTVELFLAGR
jgi:hypothetical protein